MEQEVIMDKLVSTYKPQKLYCYSKPNVMEGHKYSDDVAICYADSLKDAMSKFNRLYDLSLLVGNVKEVRFNDFGIYIATDY
jgi:hypothetical protein